MKADSSSPTFAVKEFCISSYIVTGKIDELYYLGTVSVVNNEFSGA